MLVLYGVTPPPAVNFPPYISRVIMAAPWVVATRPLALNAYHPLLVGSRKNFPKISGNGKVTTNEHIKAFFATTHILGVGHEDVVVRLFMETLSDSVVDWFYHLDDGSITNWVTLRFSFEARFKTIEDEHVMLT